MSWLILLFVWQWGSKEKLKRQPAWGRKYCRKKWDIIKGYLSKDFWGHISRLTTHFLQEFWEPLYVNLPCVAPRGKYNCGIWKLICSWKTLCSLKGCGPKILWNTWRNNLMKSKFLWKKGAWRMACRTMCYVVLTKRLSLNHYIMSQVSLWDPFRNMSSHC